MINICSKVYYKKWYTFSFFSALILNVILIMSSCTKEIDINIADAPPKLVLNSIFNPEKAINFVISSTTPILSDYDTIQGSIHLVFTENKICLLDTTIFSKTLKTRIIPKPNTKYYLEISSGIYPLISTYDSIPSKVEIDAGSLLFPAGIDKYGDEYAEASVTFTDPIDEQNFYELIIYSKYSYDSIFWINGGEFETTDPVIINEGDADYHPSTYFFSDQLFNGQKYTMHIKHGVGTSHKDYAILRSVSRNYYLYRKFYTRHVYSQQSQGDFLDLIFKGEPQSMFSNVVNGYGIFAGYSESRKLINVTP